MADGGPTSNVFTLDDTGGSDTGPSVIDPTTLDTGGNAGSGGDGDFNPDTHIRERDGTIRPRLRARRGSGGTSAKTSKVRSNIDPKGVEALLLSIHMGLALRIPEMALDPQESAKLASAIADVQSYYPVAVIDPKIVAWCNLGIAAVMIYGPRAYNIRARIIAENAKPAKAKPAAPNGNGGVFIDGVPDLNNPFPPHH